jgi:hypothetical protein
MYINVNKICKSYNILPSDETWTDSDHNSAVNFELRLSRLGIPENERKILVPCYIMIRKSPGTLYPTEIMERLYSLSINKPFL